MPPEHGQRLAKLLPHGQLVEVDDSYTLIPLDQPARLAQIIREFTPVGTDRFGSDRYTSLFWAAGSRQLVLDSPRTSRGVVVPLRTDLDGGGRKRC